MIRRAPKYLEECSRQGGCCTTCSCHSWSRQPCLAIEGAMSIEFEVIEAVNGDPAIPLHLGWVIRGLAVRFSSMHTSTQGSKLYQGLVPHMPCESLFHSISYNCLGCWNTGPPPASSYKSTIKIKSTVPEKHRIYKPFLCCAATNYTRCIRQLSNYIFTFVYL